MSIKKGAIAMPTATIFGRRIVRRTITKKIIFGRIIIGNKGMEGSTVMEIDRKMQKI
jgi:hypothetical protein